MATDTGPDDSSTLSPDEAFDLVGEEARLQILRALGEADGPLAYSELFERVEYDDSSNFNYHLEKLLGHFVRKTDEGYEPRLAGRHVVQAIFSGVVTNDPVLDRTEVDMSCMYCGAPVEMGYHDSTVLVYCAECEGQIERKNPVDQWPIESDDIVGYVAIPPAGVYDRTPTEILEAAAVNTVADLQSITRGICPQCTAVLDESVHVCEDHDAEGRFCERCNHQFGVSVAIRCTNCTFESKSPLPAYALGTPDLLGFMIDHDVDPFVTSAHLSECEEEILSTEPLEARYTFSIDGDSITLIVDEDLSVVEVTGERADEPR